MHPPATQWQNVKGEQEKDRRKEEERTWNVLFPFELKTGKYLALESFSAQVLIYSLLMSDRYGNVHLHPYCQPRLQQLIIVNSQVEEEASLLAMELQTLQSSYEAELKIKREYQLALREYEKTFDSLLKDQHKTLQPKNVEETFALNQQLTTELQTWQQGFKDLQNKYKELKGLHENSLKNEQILNETVHKLQQALGQSESRYEALRKKAESKLQLANDQINHVNQDSNRKQQLLQSKLQKLEVEYSSLEQQFSNKQAEASSLSHLCEELIRKFESTSL